MERDISQLVGGRAATIVCWSIGVVVQALVCGDCLAADGGDDPPPSFHAQSSFRCCGVLEESYCYHRQQAAHGAASTIEPASGWYGYGFPVQTYRWGWFGAEHYYPRVLWHDGYYGECCRYSYRRGY